MERELMHKKPFNPIRFKSGRGVERKSWSKSHLKGLKVRQDLRGVQIVSLIQGKELERLRHSSRVSTSCHAALIVEMREARGERSLLVYQRRRHERRNR